MMENLAAWFLCMKFGPCPPQTIDIDPQIVSEPYVGELPVQTRPKGYLMMRSGTFQTLPTGLATPHQILPHRVPWCLIFGARSCPEPQTDHRLLDFFARIALEMEVVSVHATLTSGLQYLVGGPQLSGSGLVMRKASARAGHEGTPLKGKIPSIGGCFLRTLSNGGVMCCVVLLEKELPKGPFHLTFRNPKEVVS